MNRTTSKWYKAAVCTMLAAGLLIAPLSGAGSGKAAVAAAAVQAEQSIQLWVDGSAVKLSAPIYKENGVSMAPMEDLLGALGASSVYESTTGTIIIQDFGTNLSLAVGKREALVNGFAVQSEAAPALRNNVVYVPLRFIAEQLDAVVEWDGRANSIRVASRYYIDEEEYGEWAEEELGLVKLSAKEIVDLYDESVVMIMTNKAQGSGIAIGEDLILTNYHVIEDASSATVYSIYYDELKVKGVVAVNENADLAVIRTEEPLDLTPVEASYIHQAYKGERVYAIGSPFGLQNTVSEGLISNLHYEAGVSYIQTNAPIDHGSSGGALFNEYGQLVGITTSGYSNTNASLNFAVSARYAALLIDSITEEDVRNAAFLDPSLPDTLVGVPLADVAKLLDAEFGEAATSEGPATFKKWEAKRDAEGWLVLTANIDPRFYLYYGSSTESELRFWAINLGHELHRMLPDDRIQVLISFERDYGFQPRGFAPGEVTPLGDGKWRVRHAVIDMQLKDQMYIKARF